MASIAARPKARHYSESFQRSARSTPALQVDSVDALDLQGISRPSVQRTLSAVRSHVLSYLSDLETRLTLLDFQSQSASRATSPGPSPRLDPASDSELETLDDDFDVDDLDLHSDDVSRFVNRGFQLLNTIRTEVSHHLPEYDLASYTSSSNALDGDRDGLRARSGRSASYSRLPVPDSVRDLSGRLPSLPTLSMDSIRKTLSEVSHSPLSMGASYRDSASLSYIPRLQDRLSSLQAHLQKLHSHNPYASALPMPSRIDPPQILSDLIRDLLEEDTPEAIAADIKAAQVFDETMHEEIKKALVKSEDGFKLIAYDDLPFKWQNNHFVHHGYRFIPAKNWPLLILSVFTLHNESANIHTHFLPLLSLLPLTWAFLRATIIPRSFSLLIESYVTETPLRYLPTLLPTPAVPLDRTPELFFILSAACCLLCSSIWHTFAGCASDVLAEAAARVDYIGIGWLISASVQSTIYYGFGGAESGPPPYRPVSQGGGGWLEQVTPLRAYTALCIMTGAVASVVPFQQWFNERKNKKWRIVFFLGLAFASLLPLTHLSLAKGPINTLFFVLPDVPSWLSYVAGLVFYATHFPENCYPGKFDNFSSHAIWHMFIVIAIRSHYTALSAFKAAAPAFAEVKADWRQL